MALHLPPVLNYQLAVQFSTLFNNILMKTTQNERKKLFENNLFHKLHISIILLKKFQ